MDPGIAIQVDAIVDLSALNTLHHKARAQIGRALAEMGERYARDVSSMGLTEAGLKSRSGRMAASIKSANRSTPAYLRTFVYPTAKDPSTGYGYAYALGLGSQKNETNVRAYVRGSNGRTFRAFRDLYADQHRSSRGRRPNARRLTYTRLYKYMTPQRRSEIVEVKAHHRKVNLKARPYMAGSAWARLEANFEREMADAMREAIIMSQREKAADAAANATEFDGLGAS